MRCVIVDDNEPFLRVNLPLQTDAARLTHEQAALHRVALLMADGVPTSTLFGAVTEEVGQLLGGDLAGLIRFDADEMIAAIATWAAIGEHADVSGRWSLERRSGREEDPHQRPPRSRGRVG